MTGIQVRHGGVYLTSYPKWLEPEEPTHILHSLIVRRFSAMALVRYCNSGREELPAYMVIGAMQRAREFLEEFGARPPRERETLYTNRRLKKDFAGGLAWMRGAFRHSPEYQIEVLGYFLYSRGVAEGSSPSKCVLELPWPGSALGDETSTLDLLPKFPVLQDGPPAKSRRCRAALCDAAPVAKR